MDFDDLKARGSGLGTAAVTRVSASRRVRFKSWGFESGRDHRKGSRVCSRGKSLGGVTKESGDLTICRSLQTSKSD